MENRKDLRSLVLASFAALALAGCNGEAKSPDGMGSDCVVPSGGNSCSVTTQKIGNTCSCKQFDIHGQPLPDGIGTVQFH